MPTSISKSFHQTANTTLPWSFRRHCTSFATIRLRFRRGERLKFIIYPWGECINIYKRFCLLILINGYVKLTIIDCWNIWNEKVKDVEMNSQFSPAFTFKSRPTHGTLIFLPLQSFFYSNNSEYRRYSLWINFNEFYLPFTLYSIQKWRTIIRRFFSR